MNSNALRKEMKLTESQTGFLLLLPSFAVFCIIILYPFINSIIMSFFDKSLVKTESAFVGLENYAWTFADPNFPGVLKNTIIFVIGGTALPFLLAFCWAIVLNQKFRGAELMRGITLVCWIIPSTSISFLWMWIFNSNYGIINSILMELGIVQESINWLGSTKTAMLVVIIAKTWQTMPWFMTYLIGGLQGVSSETIESARIDGAGNIRVFKHIILPEMKSIIYLILILGTIGSLQHFDLLYVMTSGGPARSTTTLAIELYNNAFRDMNLGRAAAIGTVWIVILGIFGVFYMRGVKEDV